MPEVKHTDANNSALFHLKAAAVIVLDKTTAFFRKVVVKVLPPKVRPKKLVRKMAERELLARTISLAEEDSALPPLTKVIKGLRKSLKSALLYVDLNRPDHIRNSEWCALKEVSNQMERSKSIDELVRLVKENAPDSVRAFIWLELERLVKEEESLVQVWEGSKEKTDNCDWFGHTIHNMSKTGQMPPVDFSTSEKAFKTVKRNLREFIRQMIVDIKEFSPEQVVLVALLNKIDQCEKPEELTVIISREAPEQHKLPLLSCLEEDMFDVFDMDGNFIHENYSPEEAMNMVKASFLKLIDQIASELEKGEEYAVFAGTEGWGGEAPDYEEVSFEATIEGEPLEYEYEVVDDHVDETSPLEKEMSFTELEIELGLFKKKVLELQGIDELQDVIDKYAPENLKEVLKASLNEEYEVYRRHIEA